MIPMTPLIISIYTLLAIGTLLYLELLRREVKRYVAVIRRDLAKDRKDQQEVKTRLHYSRTRELKMLTALARLLKRKS